MLLHVVLQDDNRYNAGRGAHLTLKRAEKARALVAKLPGAHLLLRLPLTTVSDSAEFLILVTSTNHY